MNENRHTYGFSLVELMIVLATAAILAALILPMTGDAPLVNPASTDAANLRTLLDLGSAHMSDADARLAAALVSRPDFPCASFPGAELRLAYQDPGCVIPYFVKDGSYYSLTYLSEVAAEGSSSESTEKPEGYTWYSLGEGRVD